MVLISLLLDSFLSLVILLISKLLWNYLRSPLKSYPGPFLANFTDLWRALDVHRGRSHITQNDLHRRHGPAVRLGPNMLSLSDPSLISKVLTTRNPLKKTAMVTVSDAVVDGQRVPNLFSTTDEDWHGAKTKPIKPLFSMTKVQDFEPNVNSALNIFIDKIEERFVAPAKSCDIADYLLYFAWDAMSWVTFGKSFGLLEAGNDDRKIIQTAEKGLDYFAPVSQVPELDRFMDKNPIHRIGPPAFAWALRFSVDAYAERLEQKKSRDAPENYLDRFIEAKAKNPEVIDDNVVLTYLLNNVLAGSDTTAITMIAAVYYVLKHPKVHGQLCEELEKAKPSLPVSWKVCNSLPYLDAVMQETTRIHGAIGMMLERHVPQDGLVLPDDRIVPANACVGLNPWVINRNVEVFGPDTDKFKPERWLQQHGEIEENFQARRNKMKGTLLSFGAGHRMCMGKYLSQLESYKTIATLFAKYDIALAHPDQEWKVTNHWFVRTKDVPILLKRKAGWETELSSQSNSE